MPTDFCNGDNVDATANSVYSLKAYQDVAHELPAAAFSVGQYVYFDLSVIDPTASLKAITFSNIAMISSVAPTQRDILYSTAPSTPAVAGVNLQIQEVNKFVSAGTPVDLTFSFQLLRPQLPKTLSALSSSGTSASISVEATINLVYYGDKKREAKVAMELTQNTATASILVTAAEDDAEPITNNSPVYTIPFLTILALLSCVLLY